MKRSYKKSSPYWQARKTPAVAQSTPTQPAVPEFRGLPTFVHETVGGEHYTSTASCGGGGGTDYRDGRAPSAQQGLDRYKNIEEGLLPWEVSNGHMSVSRAILLCQKLYANIALFRNSIESAVEFSNSPVHFKSNNQTVVEFFNEWWNRVGGYQLTDNWFREYYRSGNIFTYKFLGRMAAQQYGKMVSIFGAKSPVVPIRYIILNPAQVSIQGGISYTNSYVKMLSTYEIDRLKNPITDEDKQVLAGLPEDVRKMIKNGQGFQNIYIPLDPKRLLFAFYKKQSYEPLAIPMGFPLLNDFEWKLELKKMDMAIGRTIEQVILLVTAGDKPDQYGGGVNPENLANIQAIFKNQTLGRVLVGDYTTKAEWIIPPIGDILGSEKYKQVESDIQEGLQSIFAGNDSKFANAQIKAKLFIERLKEGQRSFLNNFLLPEVKSICESMNFKNVPEIEFENIDLNDPAVMAKVMLQMAQLGILTAPETIEALETGILPDKESSLINQTEYKKQRDKGLYLPLVGGSDPNAQGAAGPNGRPSGSKGIPKSTKKSGPIGGSYSVAKITELVPLANELRDAVVEKLKSKWKISVMNEAQLSVATTLAKNIIANEEPEQWKKSVAAYIRDPKEMDKEAANAIDDIAIEHDMESWTAGIVYKATITV